MCVKSAKIWRDVKPKWETLKTAVAVPSPALCTLLKFGHGQWTLCRQEVRRRCRRLSGEIFDTADTADRSARGSRGW